MNYEKDIKSLTIKAKMALMLEFANKVLPILDDDINIYTWLSNALNDGWHWIQREHFTSRAYYKKHIQNQVVNNLTRYSPKTKELEVFLTIIDTIYYVCSEIGGIQVIKQENIVPDPFPAEVGEIEQESVLFARTIQTSLEVAEKVEQEKLWQESISEKLLKDFYTNNENEIGPPISRDYFEPFL